MRTAPWSRRGVAPPLAALALSLLGAGEGAAHAVRGEGAGLLSGLAHPVSGLDHILAMVAVGLWGAQLRAPAVWLLPVAFPMVMAFGGFLGLIGARLPGSEVAIALSALALGAAVAAAWRPPPALAAAIVGVFGLFHGYAHGAELPPGGDGLLYSAGFIVATGLLHLTGIGLGLVLRFEWGALAVRLAGGAILVCGCVFLVQAVR